MFRHLKKFVGCYARKQLRFRNDARVGSEHAVHVGVDVDAVGGEGDAKGTGGRVRATPAEGVKRTVSVDALKPSNDGNRALGEYGLDGRCVDAAYGRVARPCW